MWLVTRHFRLGFGGKRQVQRIMRTGLRGEREVVLARTGGGSDPWGKGCCRCDPEYALAVEQVVILQILVSKTSVHGQNETEH